ncbi:MAG TPA: hypothetical protein VEV21_01640 [Burkholderiales bacterium]|nr:hypothetical protein [Burkholderiales bacterium]
MIDIDASCGVRAETLGEEVGRELAEDMAVGAALDTHAADQILVYMAMAQGPASQSWGRAHSRASTSRPEPPITV